MNGAECGTCGYIQCKCREIQAKKDRQEKHNDRTSRLTDGALCQEMANNAGDSDYEIEEIE